MNTGVLIIALGNNFYKEVAANLAMSLRYSDSALPIHLVHDGDISRIKNRMHFFSSDALCPPEFYTLNGHTRYFKAKTHLYELSPFENTVFLDADMIWFQRPLMELVTNELSDVDFAIQNRDKFNLKEVPNMRYFWANYKEVKEKYQDSSHPWLYSLHSEFIWFKRTDANKVYFDKVRSVYEAPPVKPFPFANYMADELAFGLACMETGTKPHKTPFIPVCWSQLDTKAGYDISKLKANYYGYSIGGNNIAKDMTRAYNIMAGSYQNHFGVQAYELRQSKRSLMPAERRVM